MLVLSRKVGEKILVSSDIVLTILECQSNRVRVGIDAPASVPILRAEVRKRDEEEARQLAGVPKKG